MYEPQEDSFLLKSCLDDFLKGKHLSVCVDMGCGSGIQGLAMAPFCDNVLCLDINSDVVSFVKNVISETRVEVDKFVVLESDLFSSVPEHFRNKIDLIAFNPPYLPREENELDDSDLTSGVSGMSVTFDFLKECVSFLKKSGRVFFVVSSLSDTSSLHSLLEELGFNFKIVKKEHFFFEDIMIYEAWFDD